MLKDGKETMVALKDISVVKSIDYGLVFLLIHLVDKLRISEVLDKVVPQCAALLKAIIIGKIVTRGSKLSIFNWLKRNPGICAKLDVNMDGLKVDDLYAALACASHKQDKIERKWFLYKKAKHQEIFLYDITSTYFEGTQNELAAYGYNRDGKKGKMQINLGLITDSEGRPFKIEVFQGNVNDESTVLGQIKTIKEEFKAEQIIFVGDRGMKIRYNLAKLEEAQRQGIKYITGLRREEIKMLLKNQVIQLSLFKTDLAEVEDGDCRYVLSVNPVLQESDLAFLDSMKTKYEQFWVQIKASWDKRRRLNQENIDKLQKGYKNKKLVTGFSKKQLAAYRLRIDRAVAKYKMKKYYEIIRITEDEFVIDFKAEKYRQAQRLAGKYVICTNVSKQRMTKEQIKEQYKNLQNVEHAFRDFKSDNIQLRPVYHRKDPQTRGHVLLSMFSYAIIKEMEIKLFPFLKQWNQTKNCKLSFYDLLEELKNIKLCILKIGQGVENIQITQLNELQTQVLGLFKMKKIDIEKTV